MRERVAEEIARSEAVRADLDAALQRVDEIYALSRKGAWRPLGDNASPKSYYWWAEIIADGKTVRSGPLEMITIIPKEMPWQWEGWGGIATEPRGPDYNVKFFDDETTYEAETGFGSTVTLRHEVRS